MGRRIAETAGADPMVLFGALDLADRRGDYRAAIEYQDRLRQAGWDVRRVPANRSDRPVTGAPSEGDRP
jgi:hypothetical protein